MTKKINYELVGLQGPLYIDPKYKRSGFKYVWASSDAQSINLYKNLGYEIVRDESKEELIVGTGKPASSSPHSSMVTAQSRCGILHILMEIPEELWQDFEDFKLRENSKKLASLGHVDGIINPTGSIKISGQ